MGIKMDIKETTEYENCIGIRDETYEEPDLSDFLGDDVVDNPDKEWKKHWVGMPAFEQEDNPPYKKIIVSFRTKEDYEEFAKIIDQPLTEKTKSIWHPRLDRTENSLLRWIEEDD